MEIGDIVRLKHRFGQTGIVVDVTFSCVKVEWPNGTITLCMKDALVILWRNSEPNQCKSIW